MPDGYYISARDYQDYQRLMSEFRAVGKTLRRPDRGGGGGPGRGVGLKLARTTANHAPGATEAVNLCDDDFVAHDPARTRDAVNDSGVTIPSDTKLYIARFAGKWRIVQAFICSDSA